MIPSRLLCNFLLLACTCAAVAFLFPLPQLFYALLALISLLALVDFVLGCRMSSPECSRLHPKLLPLGQKLEVQLEFLYHGSSTLKCEVYDHLPEKCETEEMPLLLELPPRERVRCSYQAKSLHRGRGNFEKLSLRFASPLGLWQCRRILKTEKSEIKVYPDYASLLQKGMMHIESSLTRMGVQNRRQRGEGTDYRELREFRQGDRLSSIDWKATARVQKVITRQYQEERDQQIIFLLDCGRRMKSVDGELCHFDHALNAMILLSYVAVQHGDSVGLMTFGGPNIYLPPEKREGAVNGILDALFDVEPSTDEADYIGAAERCLSLVRKRSLIVVISNIDEDEGELQKAIALLGTRHEVLFAALRENILDDTLAEASEGAEQALVQAGVCHHLLRRRDQLQKVTLGQRCHLLDLKASTLALKLAGKYKELKSAGVI